MDPAKLVRALEEEWRVVLDGVLSARGAPSLAEPARLAPQLEILSRVYNEGRAAGVRGANAPLDARIAFSFPRDVPKAAGAVRELLASGALEPILALPRPLRVLDLGAGLGAMTWGVIRALRTHGFTGRVEATLVDEDASALEVARRVAAAAVVRGLGGDAALTTRTLAVGSDRALEPGHDLVIVGQVLSELDLDRDAEERVERHAALLRDLVTGLAPGGALVVVEPALRDRTRHLHAVRDRVIGSSSACVFAPCLHAAACPLLAVPGEWCHEDLPVDLPPWVAPLARAAGLRFQGLTFSYLVLRKEGPTLAELTARNAGSGAIRGRLVSDLIRTKGKTEAFLCTAAGERRRIRRLDRDIPQGRRGNHSEHSEHSDRIDEPIDVLETVRRGDVLCLHEDAIDERGRIRKGMHVDVWRPSH